MDGSSIEELHDLFDKVARYGGGVGQDVIPDHLHNLEQSNKTTLQTAVQNNRQPGTEKQTTLNKVIDNCTEKQTALQRNRQLYIAINNIEQSNRHLYRATGSCTEQ